MANSFLDLLNGAFARPIVIAHRGDSCRAPENTLEAARLGWEGGAKGWELDVQLSRDGVAIVLHDDSLVRTTDVATRFDRDPRRATGFRVSDFDFSELRSLDAGSWFVLGDGPRSASAFGTTGRLSTEMRGHYRSGGVRIPSLREALELTSELDWLVNVELKSFPERPPGLIDAVLTEVVATGTADRVLVSSFDHRDLVRFRDGAAALGPAFRAIPLGALVWTPLYRPFDYLARTLGANTYHVSAESLGVESLAYRRAPSPDRLRGDEVAELRGRGIPVLAYTVNDRSPGGVADHLASIGVSGLFTDDPAGLHSRDASA